MRDPLQTIAVLTGIPARRACSDAERRAARQLGSLLRAAGRESEIETAWVRPRWEVALLLATLAGIAGSLLSTSEPEVAVGICAAALVAAALELAGLPAAGLLAPRRATQNVVSPAKGEAGRVTLVVAAAYDAPRSGIVYRRSVQRVQAGLVRVTRGAAPSGPGWLVLALVMLTALAGARVAGAEGAAIGAAQLIPTIGLVLAVALLMDIALSAPTAGANDPASGAGLALALTAALDAAPPAGLSVELVLAGAGSGRHAGMRHYVRERRRSQSPADVVVLWLGPCGAGDPTWTTGEGDVLRLRYHPRLAALCARAAAEEPHLRAVPHHGRGRSGAYAARRAGWPAIAVECRDAAGAVPRAGQHDDTAAAIDPAALDRALGLCLALVDLLDEEFGTKLA